MSAFSRQLVHICDIQSYAPGRSSIGGVSKTWIPSQTGVACRYVEKEEKFADEQLGLISQLVRRLLLAPDVSVNSNDRIANIRDRDGTTVLAAGPFQILERLNRQGHRRANHLSLKLEQVKPS